MAISGSLTYNNKSKSVSLRIRTITWLDDDAQRGGIRVGDIIKPGGTATASMSNESLIPKGIGVDVEFVSATDTAINITIHLEIPAVGKHTLDTLSANKLKAIYSGGEGNRYVANIVDA